VLKEGTSNHIQSGAALGTWHALRTSLSSVITEDNICNSFDKVVIINYEIMTDDDNNNNKKANLSLFTRRMHRGR
jgi:hypothetical protein